MPQRFRDLVPGGLKGQFEVVGLERVSQVVVVVLHLSVVPAHHLGPPNVPVPRFLL